QRAEVRIFAGNDPAHTATGSSGISSATPALTPLMLDGATGKLAGRKQSHKSVPFIKKSVRPTRWPDNVLRQRRVTQGTAGKGV
ncbi:head decoration protein, partial [Escherichia coli]|uniref:head decoration protein n=1 Tax=Escherichia coli TaxID=562 RepID=UPI003EDF51E5